MSPGRWSASRWRAVIGSVVLVAAATAVGYAAGSSRATLPRTPTTTATAVPAGSVVYGEEWSAGLMRGLSAGEAAGARQGAAAGRRRGRAAGRAAARDVAADIARRQSEAMEEAQAAQPGGSVLVVGDSLEVLSSPYLQRYLPGVELTINAVGGYASPRLLELFEESYSPQHSVIVFDAGTNDNPNYPQILQSQLAAVAERVGERCMVVPTIHAPPVDGVTTAGKNRVIAAFAASHPGTQVPDWAAAVPAHPELMQPDDLHPNAEGAEYRARLIAEGVRACLELQVAFPLDGDG